jgi:hypothetical protein
MIFHVLVGFVFSFPPDTLDVISIGIWGFLAAYVMMQIVILRRMRMGLAPANSPLIESLEKRP